MAKLSEDDNESAVLDAGGEDGIATADFATAVAAAAVVTAEVWFGSHLATAATNCVMPAEMLRTAVATSLPTSRNFSRAGHSTTLPRQRDHDFRPKITDYVYIYCGYSI